MAQLSFTYVGECDACRRDRRLSYHRASKGFARHAYWHAVVSSTYCIANDFAIEEQHVQNRGPTGAVRTCGLRLAVVRQARSRPVRNIGAECGGKRPAVGPWSCRRGRR